MKRNTILLIVSFVVFLNVSSFSQTGQFDDKKYIAKNGHVFKVGDLIHFVEPTSFKKEYISIYNRKNQNWGMNALSVLNYENGSQIFETYRYKSYKIKSFYKNSKGSVMAVLNYSLLYSFYIDIESAIENDEIANCNTTLYDAHFKQKKYLNDSLAYQQYIAREREISKELAKEYLYLFQREKFNSIRQDEFEFNRVLNETQRLLKEIKNKIDTNEIYTLRLEDKLDNYNFDEKYFPVLWSYDGQQIYSNTWQFLTPTDVNKNNVKLTDLRVVFTNKENYRKLFLNEENASAFVKIRKDASGNVDRKVFIKVSFRIIGIESKSEKAFEYSNGIKLLKAEIESVEFYASNMDKYYKDFYDLINILKE